VLARHQNPPFAAVAGEAVVLKSLGLLLFILGNISFLRLSDFLILLGLI